ncbi:MAG: LPS assembly protein LptD [Candidatus Hydrogenedentes bacterium]|nr:LPS assembly protein LptD [Candidatus Hydrogenedentota bacterium]
MRIEVFSRTSRAALTAVLSIAALAALAQEPFARHEADGVLRDGVIDATQKTLYVSVNDLNEVWKVDLATGLVGAKVALPEGPASLALSADSTTLACVSRKANSVTLIRAADLSIIGSVPGKGSSDDVSALPGGGFAVANSFGDCVTLIDPAHLDSPTLIEGVSSVPSSVAASESFLAVTTRTPAALLLYTSGSQTPIAKVPVLEGPQAVFALTGDRFVVASKAGITLVDAKSGAEVAKRELRVYDAAASGAQIFVLTEGAVEAFDLTLAPAGTKPISAEARGLVSAEGILVALAPRERAWYIHGSPADTVVAATPTPAPAPETAVQAPAEPAPAVATPASEVPAKAEAPEAPAPVMAEAAPVESAPAAPVQEAAPQVQPAAPAAEPSPTPEPTPVVEKAEETAPAEVKTAQVAEEKADAQPAPAVEASERKSSTKQPRTSRIRGNQPVTMAAPEPKETTEKTKRPSASPLEGVVRAPSGGDSLTGGLDVGSGEGGFQPPDWTQPFRDLEGDSVDFLDNGNILLAEGNVRLTLDTVQFAGDRLYYDKRTGQLEVTGNVEIVQGASTAWADSINYTIPLDAELQNPPPLVPRDGDVEQNLARKLLSLGQLDATNIEIIEPTRTFKADHIVYDFTTKTGEAYGVEGQAGQVRFGGDKLLMQGDEGVGGQNLWLTTCDCEHEYYRIRLKDATIKNGQAVTGKSARLELGGSGTPLWWPSWGFKGGDTPTVGFDFDSGHKAELGYFINVGQQFAVKPHLELGIRLFPTTEEGVGFGFEGSYDFMETPAELLYRGKGEFRTLYTTQDRGYYEAYHRQELAPDTIMLVQLEHWSDREFYKDFYYDLYKDRAQPRTFVNVTHTKPEYIATATARVSTGDFVSETERMPEVTYHLLERQLIDRLYVSFDTVNGYNERETEGENSLRSVNVGRVSYDIELGQALNLVPWFELEGSWYGKTRDEGESDTRVTTTLGSTLQTRFQRMYPGRWGFSSFKHIVMPSLTYSYRPDPTMGVEETPRFDAYDNYYGRSRLESKIDNVVMGRDAETGEAWQVARLSLYAGDDFANEIRKSRDYEIELDLRPRPLWGVQTIAEHHSIDNEGDIDLDRPYIVQRALIEFYERLFDRPFDQETADKYNTAYGDYDRMLAFFYYDDREYEGRLNGRIGFAYTKTQDEVFNREILFGMGYKINEKWSVAFEHRYDFERGELYRQRYEVRRVLQCLEGAVHLTERESGWDVGVEFSLTGIPGTRLRF